MAWATDKFVRNKFEQRWCWPVARYAKKRHPSAARKNQYSYADNADETYTEIKSNDLVSKKQKGHFYGPLIYLINGYWLKDKKYHR